MAQWVLSCSYCHKDFTHAKISAIEETRPADPFLMWSGAKPEFPPGGVTLICPNCEKSSSYQRHELAYSSRDAATARGRVMFTGR